MRSGNGWRDGPMNMRSSIETKVALPALIMGPAIIIVPAVYGLMKVYGFTPNEGQNMAWVGLGVALQYVAHVYLGYRAPHTARTDLPEQDDMSDAGSIVLHRHPHETA